MRTLLAAAVLALPVAAVAGPLGVPVRPDAPAAVTPVQERLFPRIFGGGDREARERQASEDAVRIQELEERVRQLTGQVETLTYELRRQQQAAAGGVPPAAGAPGATYGAPPPAAGGAGGGFESANNDYGARAGGAGLAAPPGALGTTRPSSDYGGNYDPNVAGDPGAAGSGGFSGGTSEPVDLSGLNGTGVRSNATGTAPGPTNPALAEVQDLIDTGRYAMASERARQILAGGSSGAVASEARYMLGESLLAQRDFRGAANSFLENYTADPKGVRAPMSLVRLGTALNGLGERAAACSALKELSGAYPNLDPTVRAEAERERAAANCA